MPAWLMLMHAQCHQAALWGQPHPPVPSEPIQSRCAVLRYTKLSDAQVLARLMTVLEQEKVQYTDDGLEAIIFTAQGDMRQVRVAAATSWARAPGPRGKQRVAAMQTGHSPGAGKPHSHRGLGLMEGRPVGGGCCSQACEGVVGGAPEGEGQDRKSPSTWLVPPQALNNLQSTFSGFGFINSENVFKVQEPVGPSGVLHLRVATAGCAGAPVRVSACARPAQTPEGVGRAPARGEVALVAHPPPGSPRGPSCGPARRGSQHLVAEDAGFRRAPRDHMVPLLEGER